MIMLAFTYVSGMSYALFMAGRQWFINLMRNEQIWTEPKQLGLTWHHVFDWHYVLPTIECHNPIFPYAVNFGSLTVVYMWWRIIYAYQIYNGYEKGAESFTTEEQLKKEYTQIPYRKKGFEGYGGIPLVHFNNSVGSLIQTITYSPFFEIKIFNRKIFRSLRAMLIKFYDEFPGGTYGIDQTTVNTMIYGITRSGKGQTIILPLIDILSRAFKKCSMFVNDPKSELYKMGTILLRLRGYRVFVLNLQKMSKSMSYNPLQIIINYTKKGYYDEAQQEANRLSTAIYSNDNEKDPFWSNSSINLLNAMIFSQLDLAERHNSWNKVTMNNIYKQLTEMGGQEMPDPLIKGKTISKLTFYFDQMSKAPTSEFREMALQAFQQSRFAGSETHGSIYAGMMAGIKMYQQRDIARLTSMDLIDFRDAGFPRRISIRFPEQLTFQTANVIWRDIKANKTIEKKTQEVDEHGYLEVPLKEKLNTKYQLEVNFDHKLTEEKYHKIKYVYSGKIMRKATVPNNFKLFKKVAGKISLDSGLSNVVEPEFDQQIEFTYSEQPVVVFFVTPPHNPAYNQLVSFAIDQSFNQIYNMALGNEGKSYIRTHFIIDEGGQLPKIQDLPTKFSIGLGSELLFDFVLQNKGQLRIHYSKEEAETIISNCGNTLYILSKDLETVKEISDEVGNTTVNMINRSTTPGMSTARDNLSNSREGVKLITPEELLRLKTGEMVVVRSTARTDVKNRITRANPIFDTGRTRLPSAWQFLYSTFDSKATADDIYIEIPHKRLKLSDISYNYVKDDFSNKNEIDQMVELSARGNQSEDYEETMPISEEEYKDMVAAMKRKHELESQDQTKSMVDSMLDIQIS